MHKEKSHSLKKPVRKINWPIKGENVKEELIPDGFLGISCIFKKCLMFSLDFAKAFKGTGAGANPSATAVPQQRIARIC